MGVITEWQASHLQSVLREKGYDQKRLAEEFGFSKTTVNRWVKGKARMREASAREINKRWPEYPIAWLQGAIEERAPVDQMLRELDSKMGDFWKVDGAVRCLVEQSGYRVEDSVSSRVATVGYTDINDLDFKLSDKRAEATLTSFQWNCLKEEIAEYAKMRVSQILARGCW